MAKIRMTIVMEEDIRARLDLNTEADKRDTSAEIGVLLTEAMDARDLKEIGKGIQRGAKRK